MYKHWLQFTSQSWLIERQRPVQRSVWLVSKDINCLSNRKFPNTRLIWLHKTKLILCFVMYDDPPGLTRSTPLWSDSRIKCSQVAQPHYVTVPCLIFLLDDRVDRMNHLFWVPIGFHNKRSSICRAYICNQRFFLGLLGLSVLYFFF